MSDGADDGASPGGKGDGAGSDGGSDGRAGSDGASDGGAGDGVSTPRNAGYDEWLDALGDGEGYALVCPAGHGSVPPRRLCPECGSTTLTEAPLPAVGTVETATVVHVPPPRFADDAPYVTAIAAFGPVRLTGVLKGVAVDDDADDSEGGEDDGNSPLVGLSVEPGVETRSTDGGAVVAFRPVDEGV